MDIKLNLSYYASIMLDDFKDLLCLKLCWHNWPGPNMEYIGTLQADSFKLCIVHDIIDLCKNSYLLIKIGCIGYCANSRLYAALEI